MMLMLMIDTNRKWNQTDKKYIFEKKTSQKLTNIKIMECFFLLWFVTCLLLLCLYGELSISPQLVVIESKYFFEVFIVSS